jgi:DnaA family protein
MATTNDCSKGQQLLPGMAARAKSLFTTFYAPRDLLAVRTQMEGIASVGVPDLLFLHGITGSGKSHLLLAATNEAALRGREALYFSLRDIADLPPSVILEDNGTTQLLCLDDLETVVGDAAWEEALFHLFNRRVAAGQATCFAAGVPLCELEIALPDLRTRLGSCLALRLRLLDEREKRELLQKRAGQQGFEIPDACADYIINRSGRSVGDLLAVVERLDRESLKAQRKITIPFVREVLGY